ncbi:MAG: hypothetical protein EBZ49_12750 [Proteobacteria bacterium]|nr:hypothetical protein [Pseudomonadota bacterium]
MGDVCTGSVCEDRELEVDLDADPALPRRVEGVDADEAGGHHAGAGVVLRGLGLRGGEGESGGAGLDDLDEERLDELCFHGPVS